MKITVYTQGYNAEAYLPQCIESVLAQTFRDFEYVLIDDCSTDRTAEVMDRYARQDPRIRVIRLPKNQKKPAWPELAAAPEAGELIAPLDADDWWDPHYLEHLLSLQEETGADVVCTGTVLHQQDTGAVAFRRLGSPRLVVERERFADDLPEYHVFFRAYWGKLIRRELFRLAELPDFAAVGSMYGWDTIMTMRLLRRARRIALDDSTLYHYRVYPVSVTYRYDPRRFASDVWNHRDTVEFLEMWGPLSDRNVAFVTVVFANAVRETLDALMRSETTVPEKARALGEIARHPLVREVFARNYDGIRSIRRARVRLAEAMLRMPPAQPGREQRERLEGLLGLSGLWLQCDRALELLEAHPDSPEVRELIRLGLAQLERAAGEGFSGAWERLLAAGPDPDPAAVEDFRGKLAGDLGYALADGICELLWEGPALPEGGRETLERLFARLGLTEEQEDWKP